MLWLRLLLATIGSLIILALIVSSARSYVLIGTRWDHTCLTRNDDPQLAAAFAAWFAYVPLSDCGPSSSPDIHISYTPTPIPAAPGIIGYASCSSGNSILIHCEVVIATAYASSLPVVEHEVGHALGLDHSQFFTALMWPAYHGQGITQDDILGLQALYGVRETPSTVTMTPTSTTTALSTPTASPTILPPTPCAGLACVTRTPVPVPTPPNRSRRALLPLVARDAP